MATKSSYKDHDKYCDREHEKSKKSDNQHGSDQPRRCSPWHKDYDGECGSNGKCERSCMHDSPSGSHKTKQRCGMSTSPSRSHKKLCTPEHQPLPPVPMFHSTSLAMPHRLSSDPTSAHLSFNQSWSSLLPLDLGGQTLSHFIRECTNLSGCPIHRRCHNITIYISLHFETHCGSHQTNLQSGLWRVTLEGVGCEGVH